MAPLVKNQNIPPPPAAQLAAAPGTESLFGCDYLFLFVSCVRVYASVLCHVLFLLLQVLLIILRANQNHLFLQRFLPRDPAEKLSNVHLILQFLPPSIPKQLTGKVSPYFPVSGLFHVIASFSCQKIATQTSTCGKPSSAKDPY